MKKENLKYTAVLLSFATVITLFAACTKNAEEAETTALAATSTTEYVPSEFKTEKELFSTDESGRIFYEDKELVTDENGITVVDRNGNMIQKVTDAQGNEVTELATFPEFINDGQKISCQQFTIVCPGGWQSSGNLNFRFKNESEGKSIEYSFFDKSNENFKTVDERIKFIEDTYKSMVDDGTATLTRSTTQVAGRDAVKFVVDASGENAFYMESYYVETENGIMCFNCFCKYEDKGFDFKAILDTIEYRIQ